MPKSYAQNLAERERRVKAIYISSYIPRACGIATFTKDLTNSINVLNPLCLAEIIAVDPPNVRYKYPWEVKYRFDQEDWASHKNAAEYINQSSADIVCLEHEYGLFGQERGQMIVPFIQLIKKPVVVTFHTVIPIENEKFPNIIKDLAAHAEAVVVMMKGAAERLINDYGVDAYKVVVIPHGVPDMHFFTSPNGKGALGLTGRTVLSTFGLINAQKGIEYTIQALPEIIKSVPNITYLVLGETHPVVKEHDGEKYRRKLQALVRKLKLQNHVRFENRYLTLDELMAYLQASDLYITPYLYPQQITSGTLSYAVGAGLPCISTPYLYAQEVLDESRGVLVEYRDPESIAQAVIKLAKNNAYRLNIKREAYAYGRQMTWDNVALKHLDLFVSIIDRVKARHE